MDNDNQPIGNALTAREDHADRCGMAALAARSARYHEREAYAAATYANGTVYALASHVAASRAAWVEALAYFLGADNVKKGG